MNVQQFQTVERFIPSVRGACLSELFFFERKASFTPLKQLY
jgi:hypothetical protein